MTRYIAKRGSIEADDGRQIAIIVPTSCGAKVRDMLAKMCAAKLNDDERQKERLRARAATPKDAT